MAKKRTILICGNYGAGNFGDELILEGLLKPLRTFPYTNIYITSRYPHGEGKFCPFAPSSFRSFIRSLFTGNLIRLIIILFKTDLILFGGGCLFNEGEPASIRIWYSHFFFFRLFRKKIIIIGQSFSPMRERDNQKKLRTIINGALRIFVRDSSSRRYLDSLKTQAHISVLPDSAFFLEYHETTHSLLKSEREKNLLLISLRSWPDIDEEELITKIEQLSRELYGKYFIKSQIVVLQTGRNSDNEISNKLYKKIEQYSEAPPIAWMNLKNMEALYQRAAINLSMRLHGAIFGITQEVPTRAINYDPKVENLLTEIGLTNLLIQKSDDILQKTKNLLQQGEISSASQSRKIHSLASRAIEYKKFLTKVLNSIK